MSNKVNIDNSPMALVVLFLMCVGDPDLIDMTIKLLDALSAYFTK